MTWQTIDSAPKDGTRLLLAKGKSVWIGEWVHHQHITNGKVASDSAYWTTPWVMIGPERAVPTHWQPCPDPPAEVPLWRL